MDPISIAASATALIATTGKLVRSLYELHGSIEDAPLLLSSIITECTVVHTSLGVLKGLATRLLVQGSHDISEAFEIAFIGCALILSVLEKDVEACLRANKSPHDRDAVKKFQLILSKDHLQELAVQLRGQKQALTLLISSLNSRTLNDISVNIEDNREILGGLVKHARRPYVQSDHLPITKHSRSELDLSLEIDSIATSTRFAFDNEIIASRTYQKALAYLHQIETRQAEFEGGALVAPAAARIGDSVASDKDSDTETTVAVQAREHISGYQDSAQILSDELYFEVPQPRGSQHRAETTSHSAYIGISRTDSSNPDTTDIPISTVRSQSDTSIPAATFTSTPLISRHTTSHGTISYSSSVSATTASSGKTGGLLLDTRFDGIWAQIAVRHKYLGTLSSKPTPSRKILWIGDGACGKSYALMSGVKGVYLGGKTFMQLFDEYNIDTYLDDYHFRLKLQDTPGQEDYDGLHKLYYPGSAVVVIGYNIRSKDSLENISESHIIEVRHYCGKVPVILVGFQRDLRDDPESIEQYGPSVTYAQGSLEARKIKAVAYVECSAKTFYGLGTLFETITKCVVLGDSDEWHAEVGTRSEVFRRKPSALMNMVLAKSPTFSMKEVTKTKDVITDQMLGLS